MRPVVLVALLGVAVLLRLYSLSGDLTDHDAWRQTETATQAHLFLETPNILWPRVAWGEPGPGFVECEFPLFPWLVHGLYRVLGEHPILGRGFAVLLFVLSCWPLWRLSRRFLSPHGSGFALLLYALAPVVFRTSRAFMPESLSMLGALLAIERFVAHLQDGRRRDLAIAGVAMAVAILTKPTALHLGLPLCVLALAHHGPGMLRRAGMWGFAAIALLPAAAWYWHAAAIHLEYGNTFGVISGGDSKWGDPSWWLRPDFYRDLLRIDMNYGIGPLAVPFVVLGLWLDRRRHALWQPLVYGWLLAAAIYYLAVARYCGHEGRGMHYHVFTAPLLAMLAGAGLDAVQRRRWLPPALLALLALCCLGDLLRRDVAALHIHDDTWRAAGIALQQHLRPGETVLVLSTAPAIEQGVANNFEQPDLFFHARCRGRVLPLDDQTPERFERSLQPNMAWFVNLPARNEQSDPRFLPWLRAHWERIQGTPDWELWRRRAER